LRTAKKAGTKVKRRKVVSVTRLDMRALSPLLLDWTLESEADVA
jgi:hypothetical protein